MFETNKKMMSSDKSFDTGLGKINYQIVIWGIILITIVLFWAALNNGIVDWTISQDNSFAPISLKKPNASLYLEPATKVIKVGETFSVNITLDTGNSQADGVDIYALRFDPSLLEVIDGIPAQPGIQITPGEILKVNAANIVEQESGNIKFSQVAQGGTSFAGKGILATINFKAKTPGTAYLKFDFTKGSTIDSNIAYKGRDQLDKVVDGIYTIEGE
jgi:hypothetical protein